MEIMLFLMFFTSPPASKAHPVWTLHSTAQFQFATMDGCKIYGQHLQDMVDSTDTVALRGWCVDQGTGTSTYGADNPFVKKNATPPDGSENYVQIESKRKSAFQRQRQ
jgi:hypothetical protein